MAEAMPSRFSLARNGAGGERGREGTTSVVP